MVTSLQQSYHAYGAKLAHAIALLDTRALEALATALQDAWEGQHQVFFCGNGGSAGNAIHLANDFTYGVGRTRGIGMRVEALPANAAVVTCLANDLGYTEIYAEQLRVKANAGDVLVVLSGSGNSPNVVRALEMGNELGMRTFAILGYDGGKCLNLAQVPMHIPLNDMQIAEDIQLIIGHVLMQHLCAQPMAGHAEAS